MPLILLLPEQPSSSAALQGELQTLSEWSDGRLNRTSHRSKCGADIRQFFEGLTRP